MTDSPPDAGRNEIAEIRERHEAESGPGGYKDGVGPMGQKLFDDRALLLDHVTRLQSALTAAERERDEAKDACGKFLDDSVQERLDEMGADAASFDKALWQSVRAFLTRLPGFDWGDHPDGIDEDGVVEFLREYLTCIERGASRLQSERDAAERERDKLKETIKAREIIGGLIGTDGDELAVAACRRTSEGFMRERDAAMAAQAGMRVDELVVGQAMQDAWNEICSDTGCHPIDITYEGSEIFFSPSHWADQTARFLNQALSLSSPRAEAVGKLITLCKKAAGNDPLIAQAATFIGGACDAFRMTGENKATAEEFYNKLHDIRDEMQSALAALEGGGK